MDGKGFFGSLFDLSFSDFITTKILKLLYILAIIGAGIGALMVVIGGFQSGSGAVGIFSLIIAPIIFMLYVILARMWLELIIVIFRIAENTDKMVNRSAESGSIAPQPQPQASPEPESTTE